MQPFQHEQLYQGCPNPDAERVLAGAHEGLHDQVLLESLEKQFDLPALRVNGGDSGEAELQQERARTLHLHLGAGEVDDDEVAEAVNAAKSGGQDVRVGKVFVGMRCVGETRFPDFGFFQQGDVCALRGGDGAQRGKCNLQDQRTAAGCILPGIRNLKWRSRIKCTCNQ
jgi:hypothetical protein